MIALFLSLFLVGIEDDPVAEEDARVLGEVTRHASALIGERADSLHGVQFTSRRGRLCQVRAFFRDGSSQAASYCGSREFPAHNLDVGTAMLDEDEAPVAVSACFTRRGRIAAVRMTAANERTSQARHDDCATGFRTVSCAPGWAVQGLHLYFDGPAGGMSHRSLVGLRPLCMQLS